MDSLAVFSAGILIANTTALVTWTSCIAWHRMHGDHVAWW